MPEVLLVCLVHDSAALRAQWQELDEGALGPLFFALSALQRDSRLLVGGVVYRSEPSGDLDALVRPYESIERIPFLPATRFSARIKESLQSSEASQRLQLDAPSETEAPLADALAAALEVCAREATHTDVACTRSAQAHRAVCTRGTPRQLLACPRQACRACLCARARHRRTAHPHHVADAHGQCRCALRSHAGARPDRRPQSAFRVDCDRAERAGRQCARTLVDGAQCPRVALHAPRGQECRRT